MHCNKLNPTEAQEEQPCPSSPTTQTESTECLGLALRWLLPRLGLSMYHSVNSCSLLNREGEGEARPYRPLFLLEIYVIIRISCLSNSK